MSLNLFIGSHRRHEPKQVIFSDGIRPGGDLTELDGSNKASSRLPLRRSTRSQKRVEKSSAGESRSFVPLLPPPSLFNEELTLPCSSGSKPIGIRPISRKLFH